MSKKVDSVAELIDHLWLGDKVWTSGATCDKESFERGVSAICDSSFSDEAAVNLAWALGVHALASTALMDVNDVPMNRIGSLITALSGTNDPEVYEVILRLMMEQESAEHSPHFANRFTSEPNAVGANQLASYFLEEFLAGRRKRIEEVLARWVGLGVLTDELNKQVSVAIADRAELNRGSCEWLIRHLPTNVAHPWLERAIKQRDLYTRSVVITEMYRRGIEIPSDDLREMNATEAGRGALLSTLAREAIPEVLSADSLAAARQAKSAMAWRFICEYTGGWDWTVDDADPEIEQVGIVDGESVGIGGVIFVYKYRVLESDWMTGVSGPYIIGPEHGYHPGGLDYTQAGLVPIQDEPISDQVESLLGVTVSLFGLSPPRVE